VRLGWLLRPFRFSRSLCHPCPPCSLVSLLPLLEARPIILVTGCGNLCLPATVLAATLAKEWVAAVDASFDVPEGGVRGNAADVFLAADLARAGDEEAVKRFAAAVRSAGKRAIIVCESATTLSRAQRLCGAPTAMLDVSNSEVGPLPPGFADEVLAGGGAVGAGGPGGPGGPGGALGTAWVLRSLTPNHRGILQLVLDNTRGSGAAATLPFDTLLDLAADALLATTDAALRSALVELVDHGIVARGAGGVSLRLGRAEVAAALAAVAAM
jgi:hypothetical protein